MNCSMILKRLCPHSTEEQKGIYQGLCSKYHFEKILKGEKEPDILLLKGLLERLGKSPEKFDFILGEEEYEEIDWKEKIENLIEEEKYELAQKKIKQYQMSIKKNEILKQQKVEQLQVELLLKQKKYKKAYELAKIALSYTKENWEVEDKVKESIWNYPMTITEVTLLQQLIELQEQLGEKEKSYEQAKKMERFLKRFITDMELLASVYNRTILFLANTAYMYHDYEKCVFYCKKGICCLREARTLKNSVEIFQLRAKAMKEGQVVTEREWKQAYFEACSIESIYQKENMLIEQIEKGIEEEIWEFIQ
ncbi:MAG: hypothetical protein IAC13_01545 [Firmicutes bacterium]|uniref:Uncharacterized protein n=1 Tax=Candidatus Scybalomonas excrementavium TaxID=2840943 RepID=A0A9D9I024_9FIRM|nr:hypothetical protein [Candidatus Scybalomonas excrementavium]